MKKPLAAGMLLGAALFCAPALAKEEDMHAMTPSWTVNPNGPTIGTTVRQPIEADGFFFKDSNGNGTLEPYEDWRLSPEERARSGGAHEP